MKLSKKMSIGFSLILIILVFTSAFAYYSFGITLNHIKSIGNETLPVLMNSEELSKKALIALSTEKDFLLAKNKTERQEAISALDSASKNLNDVINSTFTANDTTKAEELINKLMNFEELYRLLADQLSNRDTLSQELYDINNKLVTVLAEYSSYRDKNYALQQSSMLIINKFLDQYKGVLVTTSQLLNNPNLDKKALLKRARGEQMELRETVTKISKTLQTEEDKKLTSDIKSNIKASSNALKKFVKVFTKSPDDKSGQEKAKAAAVELEETITQLVNTFSESKQNDIDTSKKALKEIKSLEYLLPQTQILNLAYQITQNQGNLKTSTDIVNKSLDVAQALSKLTMNNDGKAKVQGIIDNIKKYQKLSKEWQVLNNTINTDTNTKLKSTIAEITAKANETLAVTELETSEKVDSIGINTKQAMTLIITTSIVGLLLGIAVAVILIRSIVKPVLFVIKGMDIIRDKVENITNIMHNNLAVSNWAEDLVFIEDDADRDKQSAKYAERSDEIGQAVKAQQDISTTVRKAGEATNQVISQVNYILGEVVTTVADVSKSSRHLESASKDLADGATQQAASLEEIASSLHEMSSRVDQNAKGASKARDLSKEANNSGSTGNEKMGDLVQKMQQINLATDEITKIIKTIDDIAFQTNLLALNAAVEAARAGQHGKGFAVVAEEVRNLAARSAKAAGETSSLIENVVKEIKAGDSMVGDTAAVLTEIVEFSGEVTALSSTVADDSMSQASGITQINTALTQVDDITQRNAANAEETASSSQELNFYAKSLKELTDKFILKDREALNINNDDDFDEEYITTNQQISYAQPKAEDQISLLDTTEIDDHNWGR